MKRWIILIVCLFAVLMARAQQPELGELFSEYAGREGFTSMELGGKMMQMMSRRVKDEDKALAQLLDGIRSIRIVAAKKTDARFVEQLLKVAQAGRYKLVMSMSDQGQTTLFYFIDGGRSSDSEFLMISYGEKEQVALDIYGVFDVKDISRLAAIRPI